MIATAARRADQRAGRAPWVVVVGACLAVSVVSIGVPATLGFDPWAWLVWGREIGRWTLDTTGGPSWKPLPVAVTAVVAPLGSLAVPVYIVLARTASLVGVVVVARLAGRLGGPAAAALAGVVLWLTPDGDPRFLRLVLEGHEAPWSAALAVAALAAAVDRRPDRVLAWTWLLSLLRPEAWPFLLALVVWSWAPALRRSAPVPHAQIDGPWSIRAQGRLRWWGVGALASIPVLWFVPDWIGSGSPFHGAGTAQVAADESVGARLATSLGAMASSVPAPVWVLAAVAVALAWRRADRVPAALAGAALAWSGLVVAMAVVGGYAALGRFFLPAAAVAVVLAAVGTVEVVRLARSTRGRGVRTAALAAGLLAVGLLGARALGIAGVVDEVVDRGRLEDDLDRTIDAAGGESVLRGCGAGVVTGGTLLRSAVAWKLDLALRDVVLAVPARPAVLLLESPRAIELARTRPGTSELAAGERWTAFAMRCRPAGDG